jgi:Arc/MetJ-type ribon-helix-helix transcriptional regulator
MSAQYFIAKTVQGDEYVVLLANQVVAGPFASVAEAIRAREGLRDDLP